MLEPHISFQEYLEGWCIDLSEATKEILLDDRAQFSPKLLLKVVSKWCTGFFISPNVIIPLVVRSGKNKHSSVNKTNVGNLGLSI